MTCRWRGLGLMWRCLHGCWCEVMMSPDDINICSSVRGRCVRASSSVWWRDKYSATRVGACEFVRSTDSQANRSGDNKAVLAARVAEIRAGSRESLAAHVIVPGAVVHAWWRVRLLLEVGFLGFGRDMPWSTSVLLVSSGKGLMCTDLIGRDTNCLVVGFWHSTEPWWLRDAVESRSNRQTCVTFDGDVHVRIFFAC